MASVSDEIAALKRLEASIAEKAVDGCLLFVDLVGSTAYKIENGEASWLTRLSTFYKAVEDALGTRPPTKYLGDGVLVFFRRSDVSASDVAQVATSILSGIDEANLRYRGQHKISVRIVLGFGKAYLFANDDPQGTCVDKLFRMEKYVPAGCIGLTEEFANELKGVETTQIGQVALRGLAGGRHPLSLLGKRSSIPNVALHAVQSDAALRDIWDLGSESGEVVLVSGYVPADASGQQSIQLGDSDAVVAALQNLAKIGRISDTRVISSRDVQEQDLRHNVVCVGGPYWNSVTRRFMQEIQSPYVFDFGDGDDTPLVDAVTEQQFRAAWGGGRLRVDYGFFARFVNPLNKNRHVILACGIETQAVSGVMQAFSEGQVDFVPLHQALPRRPISDTRSELDDFFAVMKFEVEESGRIRLPALRDQVSRITFGWPRGSLTRYQGSPPELAD